MLSVEDLLVKGLLHDVTAIIRWSATDTLPDGSHYRNRRVYVECQRSWDCGNAPWGHS